MPTLEELEAELAKRRAKKLSTANVDDLERELAIRQRLASIDTTPRSPDLSGIVDSPLQAGLIAAGKGMTTTGRGIQRLAAYLSGDEEENERIKQLAQSEAQVYGALEQEFPKSTFVGEVVGETASMPVGGLGKSLLAKTLSSMGFGGVAGGISEAGQGGSGTDVLTTAGTGAALGPVGEAVGALVGRYGSKGIRAARNLFESKGVDTADLITETGLTPKGQKLLDELDISPDEFKSTFGGLEEASTTGDAAADFRIARAEQEGVKLTQGQSTRDFAQQSAEDTLKGLEGKEGQRARLFFNEQQRQLNEAKERFVNDLGGMLDATRTERGVSVRSAMNEINQAEKDAISRLYSEMAAIPGGETRLNSRLYNEMDDELVRELAPSTRIVRGVQNVLEDFGIKETEKKSRLFVGPLTFKNAEQMRQRLNKLNPIEPSDIAYVAQMKQGLDDLIAGAVDVLPENEPIKIAAEKARKAAADRFGRFKAKDIVENLTSFKNGTRADRIADESIMDSILASGNKKVTNLKAVKRVLLNNATPQSRQAWAEIQTQAMLDIFGKAVTETPDGFVISGAKLNSAIDKFGNEALSTVLDKNQAMALRQLKGVVGDATIPVPRTTNPSGTGMKIINAMQRVISNSGLSGKIGSYLSLGADMVKDQQERKLILQGIEEGATKMQRNYALLQLASSIGTRQAGLEELERE